MQTYFPTCSFGGQTLQGSPLKPTQAVTSDTPIISRFKHHFYCYSLETSRNLLRRHLGRSSGDVVSLLPDFEFSDAKYQPPQSTFSQVETWFPSSTKIHWTPSGCPKSQSQVPLQIKNSFFSSRTVPFRVL